MPTPFVTIAIPCFNEARFIEACLCSIREQTYPPDRVEILIADGGSTDGTRDVLARFGEEDRRIRLIDNPGRIQAAGLNCILRQARGEIIARIDVHCDYAGDYVEKCVQLLQTTGADNVGGVTRAKGTSLVETAVAAAYESHLGMGGAAFRSARREGFVDTLFPGVYRREVFETVGLYDPGAVTNEDAELNQRLVMAGGRIYLSPSIEVLYRPRATLPTLARQYFRYGRGRARTILKHRRLLNLRPALPFTGTLVGLGLLFSSPWHGLTPWAAGSYAAVILAEAVRVGRRLGPLGVCVVAAVFPALHLSHGLGFGWGLARYTLRPDWGPVEHLPARPSGARPLSG